MRTLNLGILAHVDAGKTTLTERLLFTAGAIDRVGSVDAGTTQTDSLDLERERGITIRSAVASFLVGDLAVNLVDTPGHPDFIAEVERVLGVLDGAVLVVSAVEGVQPQTPLLFRALQRLHVPTLIFVNKIDRAGRRSGARRRGDGAPAVAGRRADGPVRDRAVRRAFVPFADDATHRALLTEVLAEHDEAILRAFVGDEAALTHRAPSRGSSRRRRGRAGCTRCTSARPRRGRGSTRCSPASTSSSSGARGDPEADVSGRVFKIERTPAGERVAYVRLFAGTLRPRQRVRVGGGEEAKPTSIKVFAPGRCAAARRARGRARWRRSAGSAPSGSATRSASRRRARRRRRASRGRRSRPSCSRSGPTRQGSLRAALAQLAEQDPLIDVRQDDHRHEIAVSLYGEVQKEVIQATLERDYGIAADFRETTTVCIERPARAGEAEEVIRAKTHTNITGRSSPLSTNPFLATLALRIEPAPFGSGIEFRAEVEPRLVPLYLFKTLETFPDPDGGVRPRGARRRAWPAGRSPTAGSR